MTTNLDLFAKDLLNKEQILESFQGWNAYAKWADSYKARKRIASVMNYLIDIKEKTTG